MSVSLLTSISAGNLAGSVTEPAPGSGYKIYKFSLSQPERFYATAGNTGWLSLVQDKNGNNKSDAGETLATSSKSALGFKTLAAGTYNLFAGSTSQSVFLLGQVAGSSLATAHSLGQIGASAAVPGGGSGQWKRQTITHLSWKPPSWSTSR